MGYFRYRMITKSGQVQGGLIHLPFENPVSARNFLEAQGAMVVFAEPLPGLVGRVIDIAQRFFEKPVKREELAEALTNFAVMLKAGIPMLAAVQDSLTEHDNPTLAKAGREMVQRIQSGSSLSEAASHYERIFPATMLFLIKLGEESGNLDKTIKDAALHEQRMDRITKDTKQALISPAFMFVAILGAMAFWMVMVVPGIVSLLKGLGVQLPPLTVAVISLSEWLTGNALLAATEVAAVVITIVTLIRKVPRVRRAFHAFLLKIPVIKLVLHASNLAFITQYFSMMLAAGVDVMHSLNVLQGAMSNMIYQERLKQVRESLVQGNNLKDSFGRAKIFPSFVVRMISVGEQSGTLSQQLDFVADAYRVKLQDLVANMSKMIQPIALIFGGGLFLVMIAALFAPLYSMIGGVGKAPGGR
ncbi:MAG: type II secretion system F family protein [Magnetococcales bacterium]|nr:type II secretion system F family protein [Magnetococcales bacterium]